MDFPKCLQIHIVKAVLQEKAYTANDQAGHLNLEETPKSYSVEMVRKIHKDAYKPWTPALDIELTTMYCEGIHVKDIANHFGRTKGAIISRIKKLELAYIYK